MIILITGATGFLGKALTKFYLENTSYKLVLFARNECKLSEIKDNDRVSKVCGDVRDYDALLSLYHQYSPTLVIHTAALKRIDTCQENPIESLKTNVLGTVNLIKVCKLFDSDLCFVSTDKACEPCTTYGATKYLAEQLVRRESQNNKFQGFVVRYGNVLESTGSVLGLWQKQFSDTGKVIVRDRQMTRFFWSVSDSVQFIHDSCSLDYDKTAKVFLPKIKSLNIYDMAAYLYGEDNIMITSCSHTEKIHESLSGDYCSKDHVVSPSDIL